MPLPVFISYSHDSQEQMDRVWQLSERLRRDGVDCRIDQHGEPEQGWPRWSRNQVQECDFVLIACTKTYLSRYEGNAQDGVGRGSKWEGFVITQELYEAGGKNSKFIPILFAVDDKTYIPIELRAFSYYEPLSDSGYDKLFRRITGQPERTPSPIADQVRQMPKREVAAGTTAAKPELQPVEPMERKSPEPKPLNRLFAVPFPENPFFTGREDVLDELKATLKNSGIAALTGLGGVGKTQTAAHYAHHHRDEYPSVLWLRAETTETLFSDLSQLAAWLVLPERDAKEQSVVLDAVKRWLDEQERWLLVLDNVEDYEIVEDLTHKANRSGHHIIITTQRQAIDVVQERDLDSMGGDLGALLLLRRAKRLTMDQSLSDADPKLATLARKISDELGGLPLALDQAGAYIHETRTGLQDYLSLLKQRAKELLDRRGGLRADHLSVAQTFLTSFEKLQKLNMAAAELLQVVAFLPPDDIPEEIFTDGAAEFESELSAAASDPLKWNDAVGAALRYSLLKRDPDKKLLAVHRMVQAVLKSRMNEDEQKHRAEQVVRAVNKAFPSGEFETWPRCERLVPGAQICAALAEEYAITSPEAARLLSQAGYYLSQRARFAEAEPLYRKTVTMRELVYGPEHAEYAIGLTNLAQLLHETNRLAEAEPLMRRALAIDEKALGPDHPNVARDLNNLGWLLKITDRVAEAEPLIRRALAIGEKALGPNHPDVAIRLNNLAQLLQDTNRLAEAEPLMRRVLAIDEKAYDPDHPDVGKDLNNLAWLLKLSDRLGEAEPLMRRALAIGQKAYGPDHPDVARDLNNLGLLLRDTNRLGEAEPLMRRALAIVEKSLGPDHPWAVMARNNLAGLLRQMGKPAEADDLG
jgi:tetratricopeptide (TPR) repeat protein